MLTESVTAGPATPPGDPVADAPAFRCTQGGPDTEAFQRLPAIPHGTPLGPTGLPERFSTERLAIYFGLPGISRDLHPASPWVGADHLRVAPPRCAGDSDPAEFRERFTEAVARAMDGHDRVAVALSGGLDSAALVDVAARLCRQDGRQLVTVTLGIADDAGRRTPAIAGRLLDFLRIDAERVVIEGRPGRLPEPAWTARGPRFDAWPRYHAAMVERAADLGATVLLHGTGSDQLLQVPPYLPNRRPWRPGGLARDFRPDAGYDTTVVTRMLAAGRIRGAARARMYWATAWPGFATDRGSPVLTDEHSHAVVRWLAEFQEQHLALAQAQRLSWAEAVLMHRLFPYDDLDPAGELPEHAPFLDPQFARYAYHLPLASRHVAGHPNAYLRGKGLVADLLPAGVDTVLAPRRQRCYKAYRRYWQCVAGEAPHLVRLGLVRPDWRSLCRDAFDLAMVMSCEQWVRGALERGATATGPSGSGPDGT